MNIDYYGEYRASTSSGCVRTLLTEAQDDLQFPPQLSYRCTACDQHHSFRLARTYQAQTPGQRKQLLDHAERNGFEAGIAYKT